MTTHKARHNRLFKSIAAGVMCLFLANQIVWAHPTGALKPPGLDDPKLRDEVLDELWKRRYEVHEGNRLTATPDGAKALPETIADLPAIWAVSPKDKRRSLRIANVQLERAGFEDNTERMVNIISKLSELGDDVPDIVLFPEMIDIVMSASDRVVKERHRLIADIVAEKKIAVGYCVYCVDPLEPKGKSKVYYHIIKPAEDNGVEEEIFEKEAFTREGRKIHLKEGCDAGLFICSEMNSLVVEGATPETLQAYANNINGASAVLIPSSVVPAGTRHWAQAVFNRFGVPVVASNATVGPYVPDGYGSGQSFFISNNGQIVKIPGGHEEAILIADVTKGRAEPGSKARPALDVFLEEHYERGAIYSLSHIEEEGDYAGRLKEIRAGLQKAFIPVRRDGKSLFEYIEELMPVMRDGRPEEGLEFQICVAEDGQDIDPLPFDVDNPQQAARAHISNGRLTIIYTSQELEENEVWVTVDGKAFSVSCAHFAVAMAAHEFDSRSEKGEKALAGIADPAAAQIKLRELERYRIELQNSILTSEAGDIPKAFQDELAALTFKAEFSLRGRDYAGKNEKRRKDRRRRKRHEEVRRRFLEGGPTDIPQQPTRPASPTQDADRAQPDMAKRRLATDRAIDILQGRIQAINQRVIDQLPQQPPQTPGSQYSIPDDIWNEYWAIFEEIADIDEDVPELRALREELARPARSPGAIMRVLEGLFLDGDRLLIFYSRQYPHKDWNVVNLPFLSVCEAGHKRNELVSIAGLRGHIFAVFSTDTIVPNCLGYPISTGVYRDIQIEGGTLVVISTEELGEVFGRYYEARLSIARSGQLPAEMQSGIPEADVSMVEFLRRTWPDDEFRPYAEAPDAGTNAGFQNFAAAYLRDYVESVAQHEIVHVLTPRSNIAERCAYLHDLQPANRWRYLRLFNMVEALTRPGTHSLEHTQTSGFMIYGLIPIIMQRRPNDELPRVSGQLQAAVASKPGQPQVAVFRLLPLLPDDIFQPEYTRVFADLAQEQPRGLGGRFDKKEGGSVEDIVVAAYQHPMGEWTIKELRAQSGLISSVSERTNQRDAREARQRGWIEPVEGSRHRYRLTQAGRDYVVERHSFTLAVDLDEVYLQEFPCEDVAQYRDRTPSQVRVPRSYSAANVDFKVRVGKAGPQPKLETESIGPTSSRLGSGKIGNCEWGDAVFMKLESENDILGTAFAEGCDVIAGTVFINGEPYLFEYHRTDTNERSYDFLNWLLELDNVSNEGFECYILTERNTEQKDRSGSSLSEVIERLEGKHEGIFIKVSKRPSQAPLEGSDIERFATAVTVSRYGVVERTLLYVPASAISPVEWLKSSPRFHAFRSAAAPSIVQSSPTHLAEGKRPYDSETPFSDGIADAADASHAQPQTPKFAQGQKGLLPSKEAPAEAPKGDPANLYDATKDTYSDIEYIAGRAGVAISTAAKDLRLLYLAGVLERWEITRNKRKMYKYRRTQNLQRLRGWKMQGLISGFLNDIFNRDNPKNRGNVTRYREGGEKDALIAALRENFVVRKKMHREQVAETPSVLSIYEKDARTTGEIISEVKNLRERYGKAAPHKYILTINDRKTNAYQRAAVRNMASSIAEKMGAEIGFARADDRDEPTFIFECRDADGNTIGKAKVEEYASAISLDRTVAILNLGLGASSVPHWLNEESIEGYMPLLKCVNDQYRRIDVLGRDLIRFLDMPSAEMSLGQIDEIVTILHDHTISAILPPVEKADFNTPDEKRLQYEALGEYA